MNGGKTCSPGTLAVAYIPFSDYSGAKRRPVLVIARFGEDFLVCNVTSNFSKRPHHVPIDPRQVRGRGLHELSVIKVHALSTVHYSLIGNTIGVVNAGLFDRVREEFRALV